MTSTILDLHRKLTMTPEFSRIFNLEKVGQLPYKYEITATQEELEAVAKRFDLLSVKHLGAVIEIRKSDHSGDFEVLASVKAHVVQACIVTLQEVSDHLEFEFKLSLVEGDEDRFHDDMDWHTEAEKEFDLEFYQNNEVDFGEITSQYLSLELNPYPRADGVIDDSLDEASSPESVNPFAVLNALKGSSKK